MTLTDLLPDSARGAVAYTFDCMEIAERQIKAAFRGKEPKDVAVFMAMCPSDPLKGKSLELYQAHAAELIARMKRRQSLEPATDAELLAVCSDTSLIAPLTNSGHALTQYLFKRVFPSKAREVFNAPAPETWKGKLEEDLSKLRKKFAVEKRGVPT